jgi:PAS domain-containing protein
LENNLLVGELNSVQKSEKLGAEQMALVINAAGIGIWDWSLASSEVICNERWAEIIGYSLAEKIAIMCLMLQKMLL